MTVKKSELSQILMDIDMAIDVFESAQNPTMVERLEQDFKLIKSLIKELE